MTSAGTASNRGSQPLKLAVNGDSSQRYKLFTAFNIRKESDLKNLANSSVEDRENDPLANNGGNQLLSDP